MAKDEGKHPTTEPIIGLTVDQVAARLQVNPETIRRYLSRGVLRGVKMGRDWRVHVDELDRYLRKPPASEEVPPAARRREA